MLNKFHSFQWCVNEICQNDTNAPTGDGQFIIFFYHISPINPFDKQMRKKYSLKKFNI